MAIARTIYLGATWLLVLGILGGIAGGWWTNGLWLWASLGDFIGIAALMTPIPTAYLNDVRDAVGMATYDDTKKKLEPPGPVSDEELARIVASTPKTGEAPPRGTDEELFALLDSSLPMLNLAFALVVIAILVWLMMFKPF
jgi:hypothetical protein